MRFADIAVNLTDPQFQGKYHGRRKHDPDLPAILQRAKDAGVERILITGVSLAESRAALELAKQYNLHCTAGIHPTSTHELDEHPAGPEEYLEELQTLIESDRREGGSKRIISVGEIGLDYDRLSHSPASTQLKYFPTLLQLSKKYHLPLFLHSRHPDAHVDFVRILREAGWREDTDGWSGGVVHSFTGTITEMEELVGMGLYIGVNGCSLKTAEHLEMVKAIPLDRLLLETDAPWCSVTASHASHNHLPETPILEKVSKPERWKEGLGIKGRMEPVELVTIAHIVAGLRGIQVEELAERVWGNSEKLFWKDTA